MLFWLKGLIILIPLFSPLKASGEYSETPAFAQGNFCWQNLGVSSARVLWPELKSIDLAKQSAPRLILILNILKMELN